MKTAKFTFNGVIGNMNMEFSGKTWSELLKDFSRFQDLDCLMHQAHTMGDFNDRASLETLSTFIEKCWNNDVTKEDFKDFRCHLSIGEIICVSCEDETGSVSFD